MEKLTQRPNEELTLLQVFVKHWIIGTRLYFEPVTITVSYIKKLVKRLRHQS